MKRLIVLAFALTLIIGLSFKAAAAEKELFEGEKRELESSLSDGVSDEMNGIGIDGIDGVISDGVDPGALTEYAGKLLSDYSSGPLAALALLIGTVLISSVAEAYTYSLRYTHTKEIMSVAVSAAAVSAVIAPIAELSKDAAGVIGSSSSLMLVYLPITAGIAAFSGRVIASAGYYSAVTACAGLLSRLSSAVLLPLLNAVLSLSVCAGVSGRVNLGGVIESVSKVFKWLLTFAVSLFAAVVGMNSALAGAGDELTGRAAKFTLSSFVPLIGSSLAEAYQTIKGSLGLLRSGMGVFVILAVAVTFAPVMARALLWSLAVGAAKLVGEAFCVSSVSRILNTLGAFLSALRALLIAALAAFVISAAAVMRVGGGG